MKVEIDECQRQLVLVALARLSVERPGWLRALEEIAEALLGRSSFAKLREMTEAPSLAGKEGAP